MITVQEYLMNRDKNYPLDIQQAYNMADLLVRVNCLFKTLGVLPRVSSGYRPSAINKTIGGAKMSTHTVCKGIDLHDPDKELAKLVKANLKLLEEYGLWLENPDYTKKKNSDGSFSYWVHLDTKQRQNRVFIP